MHLRFLNLAALVEKELMLRAGFNAGVNMGAGSSFGKKKGHWNQTMIGVFVKTMITVTEEIMKYRLVQSEEL